MVKENRVSEVKNTVERFFRREVILLNKFIELFSVILTYSDIQKKH